MPIPDENVEIILAGLDQKTSAKLTAPGKLERARNVEFDKAGELSKRKGYQRLGTTAADAVSMPAVLCRLAQDRDELLILSTSYAFAVEDIGETLQGLTSRSTVRRGLISSGNVSTHDVVVSSDAEAD